ncbi:hypothetical protein AAMO2058_000668300 [Amorphochlora amoebiformis]
MANDQHLRSLCADLAKIFNGPVPPEVASKLNGIEKTLEGSLTKLDEFQAFMSSMQANRREAEEKLVPQLLKRVDHVEDIFTRIDKLENFVKLVEESARNVEDRVRQVDSAFGENKLKKFIGSLLRNSQGAEDDKKFQWKQGDFAVRHRDHFK